MSRFSCFSLVFSMVFSLVCFLCLPGSLFLPGPILTAQETVAGITEQEDVNASYFWVVRHADRDGKKDALTKRGFDRAEALRRLAMKMKVDAVYSTDLTRTKLTAKPTANEFKKEILIYRKLTKEWFEEIKKKHASKGVVLIVGHSNTVVPIVRGLGGNLKDKIAENQYGDLFVVKVSQGKTTVSRVQFGN